MARTSLAELLPAESPPQASTERSSDESAATSPTTGRAAAERPQRDPSPPVPEIGPRYLQLERKEARLRLDQVDALTQLTRRLNRARGGRGERITDNTIIRVAVDLLLAQSNRLAGVTEAALRESLSL